MTRLSLMTFLFLLYDPNLFWWINCKCIKERVHLVKIVWQSDHFKRVKITCKAACFSGRMKKNAGKHLRLPFYFDTLIMIRSLQHFFIFFIFFGFFLIHCNTILRTGSGYVGKAWTRTLATFVLHVFWPKFFIGDPCPPRVAIHSRNIIVRTWKSLRQSGWGLYTSNHPTVLASQ